MWFLPPHFPYVPHSVPQNPPLSTTCPLFAPLFFDFFFTRWRVSPKKSRFRENIHEILKLGSKTRRYPQVLIATPIDLAASRQRLRTRTFMSVCAVVMTFVASSAWSATSVHAASAHSSAQPSTKKTSTFPQIGDRGQNVRSLQQALVTQGISVTGGVDGIFGQGTSNAIKTFQSSKGLTNSGVVNSTTAFLLGLSPSPALPILGQRGAIVTALQQALTNASISVRGGIDGIFGAATTNAVSAYQTSRGITATGVVDITTAISLGIVEGSAQSTAQPTTTVPTTTAPTTTAPPATPSP